MPIINIYGTEDNDNIVGTLADETLYGLGGDDFLSGQSGIDYLIGGDGNDILVGDYGNDFLYGEGGNDAMFGGYGDDTYRVEDIGDTVNEIAGAGRDSIFSKLDWTLGANLENLVLFNPAAATPTLGAIRGTGNSLANEIEGNNLNNLLNGLGGNDTIHGWNGNDRINGGAGADKLFGDLGNDVLFGGAGTDVLIGGLGNDTYLFTQADVNITDADIVRFGLGESDRIDLRQIDAIAGDGNQAFTFIGADAFSGTAGELRMEFLNTWYEQIGPGQLITGELALVSGDIDGDGVADFSIRVQIQTSNNPGAPIGLDASDFWL